MWLEKGKEPEMGRTAVTEWKKTILQTMNSRAYNNRPSTFGKMNSSIALCFAVVTFSSCYK